MAEIRLLSERPDYAPVLAYWSYNLWYRKRPIDYDVVLKAYSQRALNDRVPLSWVAIEESMPVGMVSLKLDDLWSRKDLNPWLASLYVVPEFRKRGIAAALVEAVIVRARELGYQEIYLFLGAQEHLDLALYYGNRGWQFMEDAIDNDDQPTKIFYYPL